MVELATVISNTGVAGVLAVILLYVWKTLREDNKAEEKRHQEQEERHLQVIERNTKAITKLSEIVERRLEHG